MRSIAILFVFAALSCGGGTSGLSDISQEAFLTNPPTGALVLDVRSSAEFATGHVPNAVNIPHDQLAARITELAASKDTPVVVYCERGGRAGLAASVLLGAGYEAVFHLDGDMVEWRANDRPTARP